MKTPISALLVVRNSSFTLRKLRISSASRLDLEVFTQLLSFLTHCFLLGVLLIQPQVLFAQGPGNFEYKLESVEVVGTTRMDGEQFMSYIRLEKGTVLTDEWMSQARANILGLALFKDVVFSLKKGSQPGWAKLMVTASDDEDVLSDWAVGGEFGLTLRDPTPALNENSIFRSYRIGLISRNLWNSSHRGSMELEMDSRGNMILGQAAYGFPRFLMEEIQFDSMLQLVNPYELYLDTLGYGLKVQTLWSRQRSNFSIVYGFSWYSNRHTVYRLDDWPEAVAGPKLGIQTETRFLGFVPSSGFKASIAVIPSLIRRSDPTAEGELAATWNASDLLALTTSVKALGTGKEAFTHREEARVDIPVYNKTQGLRSTFYALGRTGQDRSKDVSRKSTEYALGLRYHSTGFIGDLSFRIVSHRPWSNSKLGRVP